MSESSFNNADQRNAPQSKILQEEKQDAYKAGQPNSHENLDSSKTSLSERTKIKTISNAKQRMRGQSRIGSQLKRLVNINL